MPTEGVSDWNVVLTGSNAKTVQTHNAVSLAPSGSSTQTNFMDCSGYTNIAVTLMNDAAVASYVDIQWSHDGVLSQGIDSSIAPGNTQKKVASIPIKARYAKVVIGNSDVAAHTLSAWAYLKM